MSTKKDDFIWEVKGTNVYLTRISKMTKRQVEGTPFPFPQNPSQENSSITFGRVVGVGEEVTEYKVDDIIHFPTSMGGRFASNGVEYLIVDKRAITAKLKSDIGVEIKDSEIFYN